MKRAEKMKLIPRDTFYCYYYESIVRSLDRKTGECSEIFEGYRVCPFLTYRKTDYGFKHKGEHKTPEQYCKYLHKYLSVPDAVKDCYVDNYWNWD